MEYDLIRKAGGDNVFAPDEELFAELFAAMVSPEEIASRNPDAIVFAVSDADQEARVRAYLRETIPTVTAIKEDRLVAIPVPDTFPGTMGNIVAVETIARVLHPEAV